MKKLIDNIENFKNEAREEFGEKDVPSFKYRVATNFELYNIKDVDYIPNDFLLNMLNLVAKNPYTQLTKEFPNYYNKDVFEHIQEQTEAFLHWTPSDIGGVKIGNDDFNIIIPNGYGDGTTKVIVTNDFAHVPLDYYTSVKGSFNIYKHDLSNEVKTRLNGDYIIYSQDQTVVFIKKELSK